VARFLGAFRQAEVALKRCGVCGICEGEDKQ
jgi:hypothetical protein